MKQPLIIDAHVHTFPTASIGEQALQGAGESGSTGIVPELLAVMGRGEISWAVMANMTPAEDMKRAALKNLPPGQTREERERAEKEIDQKLVERVQRRNLWTCTAARENPGLLPLISIDLLQTPAEMEKEIEDKAGDHGAQGLKLHPVANQFFPFDRRLWPVYAKARELNLPVLFHSGTGETAGYRDADYGRPAHFKEVLESFPGLTIILAHLGKGFPGETLEVARNYENVYFDISSIFTGSGIEGGFSETKLVEFIRTLGAGRILFGSDWPWFDPLLVIERIKNLDISEEEKGMILGQNAAELWRLGLPK